MPEGEKNWGASSKEGAEYATPVWNRVNRSTKNWGEGAVAPLAPLAPLFWHP